MAIKEIRVCDGVDCHTSSDDVIADRWIVLGDGGFKKYKGRDKDGTGVLEVYVRETADFCSWGCLRSRTGKPA